MTGPLAIGVVLVTALAASGGFSGGGQAAFAAAAGIALGLAVVRDEDAAARALRSPVVLVSAALGVTLLASAAWTLGSPQSATGSGLAALGVGALAAASAVLCGRPRGPERLMLVVAVLAAGCAILGLGAVVLRELPWAERIGGSWRPGGPFEYPPALALLQVSALPVLFKRLVCAAPCAAIFAAVGASLAVTVLALAQSRLQIALAVAVLVAGVAWSRPLLGVARGRPALVALALTATALVAAEALGGYATPGVARGSGERLLAAVIIVMGGSAACLLAARAVRPPALPALGLGGALAGRVVAAVAVVLALGVLAIGTGARPGMSLDEAAHGRVGLWAAAASAALDRPVLGAGADGFLAATAPLQEDPPIRFAHNLPLELAVELGALGLLLALALYGSVAATIGRVRDPQLAWLVVPAIAAFLIASLVDWQWHLAGSSAIFSACLGALLSETEMRAQAGVNDVRSE